MPAFDPEGFLELAGQLLDDKNYDTESKVRTAIGRAYYAAFLITQSKLENLGQSFDDEHRIHADVIKKLSARDGALGSKLNTLFDYRVDADYKMNSRVINLGPSACKFAEHIIARVKGLK
jgi:uncharacterized protein (UPF0332 family)